MAGIASLVWPSVLIAHDGQPVAPHDIWTAWSFEPWVITGLAVTGGLYVRGTRSMHRASSGERPLRKRETLMFAAGWTLLVIALVSPLHAMGSSLFSAHMVQHELLMVVAAPLIVLSRPLIAWLWALPMSWRRKAGDLTKRPMVRSSWIALSAAGFAWMVHAVAIWTWHLPGPYQLTLRSDLAHSLQHASFFLTALLFWWAIVHGRAGRLGHGSAVLYLFTTALHTGLLGALLAFSDRPWYPIYGRSSALWGLSVLEDQQLAGLIMWIPAGLAYALAALWLLSSWLRESDRRVKSREATVRLAQ